MSDLLLPFAYSALFLFLIRKSKWMYFRGISNSRLQVFFLVKALAGIVVTFIAFHSPGSTDMTGYFTSGQQLFHLSFREPTRFLQVMTGLDDASSEPFLNTLGGWYVYAWDLPLNDNRIMIRLNALISFFSVGNPYVHAVCFCFLSTVGMILLLKSVSSVLPPQTIFIAAAGLCLFPGLLCWTSVISKESLAVFLMGSLLYTFQQFLQNPGKYPNLFFMILIVSVFVFSKVYLLLLLIPSLIAWAICYFRKTKRTWLTFTGIHVATIALLVTAGKINPHFDPSWIVYQKQMNFVHFIKAAAPETKIEVAEPEYGYRSLLQSVPEALLISLTHPRISELGNTFLIPFFMENLILICLLPFSIYRHRRLEYAPFNWTTFYFSAGLLILTGLCVPVTGLLIRFRAPVLLLMVFLFAQVLTRPGSLPEEANRA
ncbi:MAG TPA: hypothetical protein PLU53_04685 [Bacteroidia bacterium]|nr:hypothetical protein [Bacteroidia bacterium]